MAIFNSEFSRWEEAFADAADHIGISPGNFIADGKIHRCATSGKKQNGWYVIYQDEIVAGCVGNWETDEKINWHYTPRSFIYSPVDTQKLHEKWAKAKQQAEDERQQRAKDAALAANKKWQELAEASVHHPYLVNKKIKPYGIKQGKNRLYMPLHDETGSIVSLQSIDDKGQKLFMEGGRVKGCFFILGKPTDKLFVCEGYATASSIFEASGVPTAAIFNAGNYIPGIDSLKKFLPGIKITLCADNDAIKTPNKGLEEAQKAAKQFGLPILWPEFPEGDNASDFNDFANLRSMEALKAKLGALKPNKFKVLTLDQLDSLPPVEWIIEGVFSQKSFGTIYGAPKKGKTFVALDMGLCVASGHDWHGQAVTQGSVLYIAGEGVGGLKNRIKAWLIENEQTNDLPFFILPKAVLIGDPTDVNELINLIDDIGQKFSLIFIDTVARAMTGLDENGSKDMGLFISACDRIKEHSGATVIPVHHSGKNEDLGMRGSNALLGAIDSSIKVIKNDEFINVKFENQKDAEPLKEMCFETKIIQVGISGSSLVLVPSNNDKFKTVKLSPTERLAYQILCDSISTMTHRGMPCCPIDFWKTECFRRELTLGDQRQKASGFNTASKRLRHKGVIGLENDMAFLVKPLDENNSVFIPDRGGKNDDDF